VLGGRPLAPGDRPALARQDDEAGLVDTPLDQTGGDNVDDNLVELVALDTRARADGAYTPPRRGIAAAGVHERCDKFRRQRETVVHWHHLSIGERAAKQPPTVYRLKGISKMAHHANVSTPKMAHATDKPAKAEATPKQTKIAPIK
jgi:hypothetical protein